MAAGADLPHDLYTFVIGAHTLHAVGYAMGLQQDRRRGLSTDGSGNAVVCYLGDGATSQGDSNEALVFAASAQAPAAASCADAAARSTPAA